MASFIFQCLFVVGLSFIVAESQLVIQTTPEGPSFSAASWIRFACKYRPDDNGTYHYNWRVSCRRSGEVIYTIRNPMMDGNSWATLWVHSTPLHCLDLFQCIAYNTSDVREGSEIASSDFVLEQVTGVGMSLNQGIFQGTVPNNSIVVVQQHEGAPRELLCQSGLMQTSHNRFRNCSAQWRNPLNVAVGDCARSLHDVENDMQRSEAGEDTSRSTVESSYNSVRVDFDVTEFEEGVYTCSIKDENLKEHRLSAAVFKEVPELEVESSYETVSDGYLLHCDSREIPPTAVLWYRGETLVSNIEEQDFVQTLQVITGSDGLSIMYRHSQKVSTAGIYSCDVRSSWMTADRGRTGTISSSAFFVVHPSSSQINLECSFPEGTSDVKWSTDSSAQVSLHQLEQPTKNLKDNTAIVELFLTSNVEKLVLTCRGVDSSGHALIKKYNIIVDTSVYGDNTNDGATDSSATEGALPDKSGISEDQSEAGGLSMLIVGGGILAGLMFLTILLVVVVVSLLCAVRKKRNMSTTKYPSTLTLEDKDIKGNKI